MRGLGDNVDGLFAFDTQRVRTAMCDQHGFYPFRDLLTGHPSSLDDLALAEYQQRIINPSCDDTPSSAFDRGLV